LTLLKSTYLRVVIITKKIPLGAESEAKEAFLWLLGEEISKLISAIDIITLFPNSTMSVNTRYRHLKECLMDSSDQIQKSREDGQTLFSITHLTTFLKYTCRYFSETVNKPIDFIKVLRIYNPIASNLAEYLLNFLKYVKLINELTEFTVLITAFSFFLNSYPPKAYSKYYFARKLSYINFNIAFKPKIVFNTIYKDIFCQVNKA
jgi:hypothetical protein